ncbi:MAG TPA: hypothetical protein VHE35_31225 [Kofleriaceae bacterium]|nr:hypothetical protein [Kofleriaceae bacterium]
MRARPRLALGLAVAAALGAAAAGGRPARADRLDGEGYSIAVASPAQARPGAAVTATVTVTPRAGWKLNTDYPFKLELAPPAGVKVAKPVLRKDDARRYAESGADVDVAITADKAGPAEVAATIRFATCDDATCSVHKVAFAIPLH